MMEFVQKILSSPLGFPIMLCVFALVILFFMCLFCALNIFGFRPTYNWNKDKQVTAISPTASYRAPITREGDVVRTTSLPRRGIRELEGHDDDRF